jgi:hypothetical protein
MGEKGRAATARAFPLSASWIRSRAGLIREAHREGPIVKPEPTHVVGQIVDEPLTKLFLIIAEEHAAHDSRLGECSTLMLILDKLGAFTSTFFTHG